MIKIVRELQIFPEKFRKNRFPEKGKFMSWHSSEWQQYSGSGRDQFCRSGSGSRHRWRPLKSTIWKRSSNRQGSFSDVDKSSNFKVFENLKFLKFEVFETLKFWNYRPLSCCPEKKEVVAPAPTSFMVHLSALWPEFRSKFKTLWRSQTSLRSIHWHIWHKNCFWPNLKSFLRRVFSKFLVLFSTLFRAFNSRWPKIVSTMVDPF